MTFGNKLKEQRKKKGLSQEQAAEKLGVSRQAVSRWEAEETLPDANNLKEISKLYGVSIDYLLNEKIDEEGAAETSKVQNKIDGKLRLALALILIGVIGLLIIYILSTQIEATVSRPIQSSTVNRVDTGEQISEAGTLYGPVKVHAFFPFITTYNLEAITGGLVIMFMGGVFLLLYDIRKDKKMCKKNQYGE